MWRFLIIAFAVMGFAFYELSGGSDYEPAPNSLQARTHDAEPATESATQAASKIQSADPGETALAEVEVVMDQLREAEDKADELSVTLASVRQDAAGIIEFEANRPKAELLALDVPEYKLPETEAESEEENSIDAAIAAALGEAQFDQSQIRWIKENIVDLRTGPGLTFDAVTQVTKGTEVAILEDPGHGWLNVQVVDNYQSGWLAEWLVMKPE